MSEKKVMPFEEWRIANARFLNNVNADKVIGDYAAYFHTAMTEAPQDVNEAIIGVGEGGGSMFVRGNYDAIKLLQSKLLELERLRTQSGNEVDVNEAIENEYPISLVLCQNVDGSPAQRDANEELRQAAHFGYSLGRQRDWISVSDRLPEHTEWVLAWIDTSEVAHICFYLNGLWYDIDKQTYSVSHWQPLPLPPNER